MILSDAIFLEFCKGKNPSEYVGGKYWQDTSDMAPNLLFLYNLTISLRPPRILEIGTADGTSTMAFLKAASEINSIVYSVDIEACKPAQELIRFFELERWWKFFQQSSEEFFKNNVEKFSLILIDGSHLAEDTEKDFLNSVKVLEKDGLILIHDSYFHAPSDRPGVSYAIWKIFKNPEYSLIVFPFDCNLSIIQKKSEVEDKLKESKFKDLMI